MSKERLEIYDRPPDGSVVNGRHVIPDAQEPEVYRETLRRVIELAKRPP
jgi:hypothetical protein